MAGQRLHLEVYEWRARVRDLSPPEQLRDRLAHFRRGEVSFDPAWQQAMRDIDWRGTERLHRDEWREALEDTRPAWEAAYTQRADPATVCFVDLQEREELLLAA